jgi:hypothetical protein
LERREGLAELVPLVQIIRGSRDCFLCDTESDSAEPGARQREHGGEYRLGLPGHTDDIDSVDAHFVEVQVRVDLAIGSDHTLERSAFGSWVDNGK